MTMMTIEAVNCVIQLLIATLCYAVCFVVASRKDSYPWLLLGSAFVTYCLGLVYEIVYFMIRGEMPQIIYISNVSVVGADIFCILLLSYIVREYSHIRSPWFIWTIPVLAALSYVIYLAVATEPTVRFLIPCVMTGFVGYYLSRGLFIVHRSTNPRTKSLRPIFMVALLYTVVRVLLWLSMGFTTVSSFNSPYMIMSYIVDFVFICAPWALWKADLK
jgi:hypothetical protein